MMRSDCRNLLTVIAISLCCLLFGQHRDVFEKHRDAVLSGDVTEADGICFGVARRKPAHTSSAGLRVAESVCKLAAARGLIDGVAFSDVRWPASVPEAVRKALRSGLYREQRIAVTLHRLTNVYSEYDSGSDVWTCVAAVEKSELARVPRLTLDEVCDLLLTPECVLFSDIPISALCALKAIQAPLPEPLDMSDWTAQLSAPHKTRMAQAIARVVGRYPIGSLRLPEDVSFRSGMKAFAEGRLREAYVAFSRSLVNGVTCEALNMIGNVGRRIGEENDAVVFLLHAAYLNPKAPYPWVHLAHIARNLGNETLKEACCRKAENLATDRWSKSQLELLRKPLPPPEPTPVPTAEPQAAASEKESAPAQKPTPVTSVQKPAADRPSVKPEAKSSVPAPVAKPAVRPVAKPAERPAVRQVQPKATPVPMPAKQFAAEPPAKAAPAGESEAAPLGLPVGLDFPGGLPIPEAERAKARELGVDVDAVLKSL